MRGAQDKHLYLIIRDFFLKLFKVQCVVTVVVIKFTGYQLSSCIQYGIVKWIVYRRADDNGGFLLGICPYSRIQ